ncbi:MAG: response regulator, partial [Aquabacterium sp.]
EEAVAGGHGGRRHRVRDAQRGDDERVDDRGVVEAAQAVQAQPQLAVVLVQVRQYQLINQRASGQDDYLVLSLQQIETEYLKLRDTWQRAADPVAAAPKADLQLRYDIFVSRIDLLKAERAARLLAQLPSAAAIRVQLAAFTDVADVHLLGGARTPFGPAAARAMLPQLADLGEPIHALLLEANHRIAHQITERANELRRHSQVGLAMTLLLSAMTLGFAFVAWRQTRHLQRRGRNLERLADDLRDARALAETGNAAKSAFLADVSHELRTPLHGLMGMLSLLKDARLDARGHDWLRTADDSAVHLLRLLDDLLDLSKLESGTLALAPHAVSLRALLHDVQALMQPQAEAKGLRLDVAADAGLPTHVLLDGTRVRQVLFNLVGNAIKFSSHGGVQLRARVGQMRASPRPAGASAAERESIDFEVSDTGIGMDARTVDQLFQRFGRGDDPIALAQRGTGLGLAISRNLARLMGGDLQVASAVAGGSVFRFRCPLHVGAAPGPGAADAPVAQTRPLRVLVAEDHPVNRKYLAALLERLGHQQRHVEDGAEAVRACREQRFDVVLMDVHMPRLDGIAATAQIRQLPPPASRTLILALTADVFEDTRDQVLRAGADDVITKPVSLDKLTALLVRYFGAAADSQPGPLAAEPEDPSDAPLIDRETTAQVVQTMGGAPARGLYAGLFDQAVDAAQRMRAAMRDADPEAIRRAAHAVKGAALNLGLPALAQAAKNLDDQAVMLAAPQLALAVQRYEEIVAATRRVCTDEGLSDAAGH